MPRSSAAGAPLVGTAAGSLLLLAVALLLVAGLVYVIDRRAGSAYLLPHWLAGHAPGHAVFGAVGGSLPSFAHAFAFSVLTALVLPASRWRTALACGSWCLLDLAFEIGQHRALSSRLAAALPAWFADVPVLDHLGAYWRGGTFDRGDLAAVVLGCVLAAISIRAQRRLGCRWRST